MIAKQRKVTSVFLKPLQRNERERERSVYLHQIFSINYRLKHNKKKKTIILHFEIKTN